MKPARAAGRVPGATLSAAPAAVAEAVPTGVPPAPGRRVTVGRRPAAWTRSWVAGILVALACAVGLLMGQLNPFLGDYGDDAEFLILGQGLATGQGYAWVNSPERPAHNRYPPGYPALLAITMVVSGTAGRAAEAIIPAKLVTAATLLGAALLLWPLARRRLPAPWGVGAVALFVLNPFALRFAGQVMSDLPYVLALLGALVWADRTATRRAPGLWSWAGLGALLALGAYVRSVGLAAAVGVLAWAWWWSWRRRSAGGAAPAHWGGASTHWGGALAATAAFLLLMLPWWLRDAALAGSWRYLEELLAAQYLAPGAGTATSADLLERAAGNVAFLAGKPGVFGAGGTLVGMIGAIVVALGYARVLWPADGDEARPAGGGAAEWAAVALVIAVLFWPIKTGRYLLPVVPLLGVYAVAGALALASWLPHRLTRREGRRRVWRAWGVRAVGAGVALLALFEGAYGAREAQANLSALSAGGGPAGYYRRRPEWARYLEAADWLREHAGAQDVALARRHFILYVYSGHYVDKYRFETSDAELAYLLSGSARKLVVEDAFEELRGDFAPLPEALRARGAGLHLRFQSEAPAVRIWELVRPPQAAS